MNEEMRRPQAEPQAEAGAEMAPQGDPVTTFLEAWTTAVGVETVFGEPIAVGERVIIPVAETSLGGGVGYWQGPGDAQPQPRTVRLASGGGAGGGATTRPVAAIVITPDEVRVQPIIDAGKLVLSGIATTAAVWQGLAAFLKAMRRRS